MHGSIQNKYCIIQNTGEAEEVDYLVFYITKH